ncbi:choice-of-anchor M domain-containing protein [Corynebacterium lizhenjunii]|uniref:Choice-of-anchor M domain-containing protein n=1 Tax=Corynebacterium lizhenjunii TaxID=2709394 RepID=A0A7T0KFY3_9CORY|nr:choice-of-anchor M domain-containing protein [Corynebacterium lizhenjunii]QPK80063.1 choice-of-anchor M domain-containing protein [Corynebacterium lizhenjunii]
MVKLCTRFAVGGLVTALMWAATPGAAAAEISHIIERGHQDLALFAGPGGVAAGVFDESTGTQPLASGQVAVAVPESQRRFVPVPPADLDTELWVLPDPQVADAPWFGFSTTAHPGGFDAITEDVTLRLQVNSGPGRVVVATNAPDFQSFDTVLDSEQPCTPWQYYGNTHAHANFFFSEPGAYSTTFTFNHAGADYPVDVVFLVGGGLELADAHAAQSAHPTDQCTGSATTGPGAVGGAGAQSGRGAKSRPQQLAADIRAMDRAVAGLDRTLDKTFKEAEAFLGVGTPAAQASRNNQAGKAQPGQDTQSSRNTQGSSAQSRESSLNSSQKSSPMQRTGTTSTPGRVQSPPRAHTNAPAQPTGDARASHSNSRPSGTHATSGERPRNAATASPNAQQSVPQPAPNAQTPAVNLANAEGNGMFWAGTMAGVGATFLLVGSALLAYVYASRRKQAE